MSDDQQSGQPEPTMEEILSSIRRIISDEDQPAAGPVAAKAPPPEAKAPPKPAEPDPFDDIVIEPDEAPQPAKEDVLELTQMVNEDGTVTDIDEMLAEPEPVFEEDIVEFEIADLAEDEPVKAAPPVRSAPASVASATPIMGEMEAGLAAAALNQLVVEMPKYIGIGQGLTVEEITRELLRPMLKQWLDAHLPGTVERLVQEEFARVSRLHR